MSQIDQQHILHWGLSHKSTPLNLRERFVVDPSCFLEKTCRLLHKHDLLELLIFQTCHRFEMFFIPKARKYNNLGPHLVQDLIHHDHHDLSDCCQSFQGRDAVDYLFRVVASLDSMLIGETQVTSQFKKAVVLADQAQTLGPVLRRLSDIALRTAKEIRHQTDLSKGKVSLAHCALDLAKTIYQDISSCHVGIIGAGTMASQCFDYAITQGAREVSVFNRHQERASVLVRSHDQANPYSLHQLLPSLPDLDILISCAQADHYFISKRDGEDVLGLRRAAGKQYFFICDMALPRSIDPKLSQVSEVYLFDVDDIKSSQDIGYQ
ncbi:MAG: glutamyl-tRNA reductase, partial [Proteobacteria bacterium]|nr:glutamyl-tRNA reductase [Pseudomonadota bacterium]